ncbi:MAG: RNA polymerase sigma factor [Cyclobacteriaceae bacterium]|nr:RNA polymerase sigma factor [Cyclobacteriaceae bacterium]
MIGHIQTVDLDIVCYLLNLNGYDANKNLQKGIGYQNQSYEYKRRDVMNEKEVFERICQGDEKALEYLYKKYYRMMTKLVISNNGTEQEAKDIYQDALLVFWQKAISKNLVLTSKISTYIYSICQNLWRKELERKKRHTNESGDSFEFQDIEKKEKARIMLECIDNLGETCKKVLMYYYYDGMSMQDIAEKLGFANTNTAKTKKYKCKQKLDHLVKSLYTERDFLD